MNASAVKYTLLFFCTIVYVSDGLSQKQYKIKIQSEYIEMDKRLGSDAKRLIGNVICKHKGAILYCDTALYYSKQNMLHAYSNAHVNQGDTIHLYADTIVYNGTTEMAKSRNNVKLIDKETTLLTEYLDFDRKRSFGYYVNGATIYSGDNTLTSIKGYYYSKQDLFEFKDSVKLVNPDYTIYCDTMKYNTQTKVTFFLGPTDIISNTNKIYCEKGWYNTETNVSRFSQNPYLISDNLRLKGDSLFYDRKIGYGEAFNNITLFDSVKNVILQGNYGYLYEATEESLMTDKALFISVSEEKDSLYIHGDTLMSDPDTAASGKTDTANNEKVIKAFHNVKIYKPDLQGVCDSLVYSTVDSIIRLYTKPILWSKGYQLSAEYIEIYTSNNSADSVKMFTNSIIIQEHDTANPKYNQAQGRNITGYIKQGDLHKLTVNGNAKSIFFPENKDGYIGVNQSVSSSMTLHLKNQEVEKVYFVTQPDATFHPLEKVDLSTLRLEHFKWLDDLRPSSKKDLLK